MTEAFLWYLWKFRLYTELITTNGEQVEVIHAGHHNSDSGPDFSTAKIKIGNTIWAGNVEVHINASDWYRHQHQNDIAFDNIILHVVYNNDKIIQRNNGEPIPVVELKNKFDTILWKRYQYLVASSQWIPCASQLSQVDDITISQWLDRLLINRLERKTLFVDSLLKQDKSSWEDSFYRHLARNFGFKTNAVPFELLAGSLPVNILAKHKNNLMQIEALLFGQSGLLNDNYKEEYPLQLNQEYQFLRKKYKLTPIDNHLWKFARLRPANFPTVRIAQFASLIFNSTHLFSKILEVKTIKELVQFFNIEPSSYWKTHYHFGKISTSKNKALGKSAIENILINTLVPFVFSYGKHKGETKFVDKALNWLEQCSAEKNSLIREWEKLGIKANNAYRSQALLELKNEFCDTKNCLSCNIGLKLLNRHESVNRKHQSMV